jgi:hypothetical protein
MAGYRIQTDENDYDYDGEVRAPAFCNFECDFGPDDWSP